MIDFNIDEVFPRGASYPLLVNFQNGYPADNFADQECVLLENNNSKRKSVATEINSILYYGEEYDDPLEKTLIVARNRKTGKTRLIEVGNVELKPMMKSVEKADELETSYIELGKKFGSKKHKKMLEQNEKLKVKEDIVTEQLKDISQSVSQEQLDLSSYNQDNSEDIYIPSINREATCVEDIYPLTSIFTEQQYETIFNEIDNSDYKSNLFHFIKDMFSDNWTKEQTVLAVYASTLLELNLKTMKEIKIKKFVACPYSDTLNKIILAKFFTYSKNIRMRPLQYKDKGLCHAIVFMFLINNYKFDMDAFCKAVKSIERSISPKITMTGGGTIKQGSKRVAILKLPLNKGANAVARRKSARF